MIAFCFAHNAFLWHAMTLSGAAVAGQFFIYSQVKEFGALVLAATMNLRQVISILGSYVLYGHSITLMQVVGLALVFGSLFYKTYLGYMNSDKEPKKSPKPVVIGTAEPADEEKGPQSQANANGNGDAGPGKLAGAE